MPWPWRASPSPSPRRARSGGQLSAVSRHKPKKEAQSQEAQGRRKGHSEKGGRKGMRGREARASMALKTRPTRRNLWSAQGRPSLQRLNRLGPPRWTCAAALATSRHDAPDRAAAPVRRWRNKRSEVSSSVPSFACNDGLDSLLSSHDCICAAAPHLHTRLMHRGLTSRVEVFVRESRGPRWHFSLRAAAPPQSSSCCAPCRVTRAALQRAHDAKHPTGLPANESCAATSQTDQRSPTLL